MIIKSKLVLVALLTIAIIAIAAFLFGESAQAPLEVQESQVANGEVSTSTNNGDVKDDSTNTSRILTMGEVWKVWTDYLAFAKAKNIDGVKSLSYQISETCIKPELKKECEDKMLAVYNAGSILKKEDLKRFTVDSKQAILQSEAKITETAEAFTATESKIVFAMNSSGKMSLLHLDPAETWSVRKKTGSTTAEIIERLKLFYKDNDIDGVADDFERCVFPADWVVFSCTETNPNKRDSDADGWWDGVEYYFSI